ncbi:hypothetical protein MTX80_18915 [Gordonia amicalis]|nr:hypothetical protein [Gordonia amicalis]UOG21060.1 hypothetical protein MTX80_18915 [Gordonia amicalis]
MSQVSEFAESLNLVLTVVTQVRADGVRSGQLAEELKADLISWPTSVSAKDQESRLQAIYREAAVCLTDRLHVAALCIREGAFPIVYSSRSDSKLLDSLSPFFPFGYVDDGQGIVDVRLSSDRDDLLREAVSGAARKLDELSARLGVIVGGDC